MFLLVTSHSYLFLIIEAIAMDHGIVDGFGQADENVWIQIFIYMQTLYQSPDEILYLANTAWIRW